jgi:hypothetical protein
MHATSILRVARHKVHKGHNLLLLSTLWRCERLHAPSQRLVTPQWYRMIHSSAQWYYKSMHAYCQVSSRPTTQTCMFCTNGWTPLQVPIDVQRMSCCHSETIHAVISHQHTCAVTAMAHRAKLFVSL